MIAYDLFLRYVMTLNRFYTRKSLLHKFPCVVFNWFSKKANSVAHILAKCAAHSQFFSFCNIDSLPLSVYEVCFTEDSVSV